jgi:hypothetical protein
MTLTAAFTNRRRRKRLRDRARRAASGGDLRIGPQTGRSQGGVWGQGPLGRQDLILVRAALRRGWCPNKRARRRLMRLIIRQGLDSDSSRMVIAAVSTIVATSQQDQDREGQVLEAMRRRPETFRAMLADYQSRRALFFGVRCLRRAILETYGPLNTWKPGAEDRQ